MGADRADADVELSGDLGVGTALGDQGDQLPFSGAELPRARRSGRGLQARGGEHEGVLGRGGHAHHRAAVRGRGETDKGGRGFRPRGRACSCELIVAGLQAWPGAQRDQALPGRAQPGDGRAALAGRA